MFARRNFAAVMLLLAVACLWMPMLNAADTAVAQLHELLQSDAPIHEKAVACERLAVVGTKASVPVLSGLLAEEKLSHYARFGLEAIPDASVDVAFRNALDRLDGIRLVGVINSIGQRRDRQAVEPLTKLMAHQDQQVAAAAAAALGRIANQQSISALLPVLDDTSSPIRTAVADACLTAADVQLSSDQPKSSLQIFQVLRESDVPPHIRVAATFAAVQAEDPSSLTLLNELLQSEDDELFAVALQASRKIGGDAVTQALIDQRDGQTPERQALMLSALADRSDKAALPVLQEAAQSDDPAVRRAALHGLAKVGDSSVVEGLLDAATDDDEAIAKTALRTLEALPGDDVDEAILSQQNHDDPARFELLIHLAGSRRINSAIPMLLKAVDSPSETLRLAAISALGETAGSDQLDVLVGKVLEPDSSEEMDAAKAALIAACVRMSDRDACTHQLVTLFSEAPAGKQTWLFELLRNLGGEAALTTVVTAARAENTTEQTEQDAATQALGEWPTEDAAPELLELAQTLDNRKYQIRALRGYIRIIRQFGLPVEDRVAMSREALRVADRREEKVLALQALLRFPSPAALSVAVDQLDTPDLKGPAAQIALLVAERMTEHDPAAIRAAMQRVIAANVNPTLTERAQVMLKKFEH